MPRGTMAEITASLHQKHPEAEGLRIRKASQAGRRFYQLHGTLYGVAVSRTLDATNEWELLASAERKLEELQTQDSSSGRPVRLNRLKEVEREAALTIERSTSRPRTKVGIVTGF